MSQLSRNLRSSRRHTGTLKKHKAGILTAAGIIGFLTTTVVAVIQAPKARDALDELDADIAYDCEHYHEEPPEGIEKLWMQTKVVTPIMAPVVVGAVFSSACIIGAQCHNHRQIASLGAAYELSEKARRDYIERVKEKIGEKEESKIRDEYYKELSKETMPESSDDRTIIQTGEGDKLFFDSGTGRYFRASTRWLEHCRVEISHEVYAYDYASANELADIIGLSCTTFGNELGFDTEDLDHSTHLIDMRWDRCYMSDWGEPYAVLEYTVHPRYR